MENLTAEQIEEVRFMVGQLQVVLGQDNDARKSAEEHLKKIREGEPDKYACYLAAVIMEPTAPVDIKQLAAVILRRGLSSTVSEDKKTLWEVLSQQGKDFVKTKLLETIKTVDNKQLIHKMSNLLVEVAGCMVEEETEEVWQDLLNLTFVFVNSSINMQVDAAL